MTDVRITQCPKCETTFRVNSAQLKVAKGAVRCGACLNVFNAADHFKNEQPLANKKQDDRTEDMFSANADSHASANVGGDIEKRASTAAKTSAAQSASHRALSTDEKSRTEKSHGLIHDDMDDNLLIDDDNDLLIDDNSGLDLIDDEDENEHNFANDLNEEFLSLSARANETNPFYTDADIPTDDYEEDSGDDESWAQALLDDDDDEDVVVKPSEPEPEPVRVAPKTSAAKNQFAVPSADLDADLSEAANLAANAQLRPETNRPGSQFQYIQADPLQLSLPDRRARRMRWMWFGLSLLAALGLVGQMAYFNFEQWSRDPQLRPWYQTACQQLSCTLPPIYDLKQIRTTATPRVNSHPKFEHALSVDILFMNHASYEQPFPVLQLSFTDKRGQLVAQRQFQPVEYLAGEAAGMNMMPSLVPVHIALEIKDPGPAADNYQVSFLANSK